MQKLWKLPFITGIASLCEKVQRKRDDNFILITPPFVRDSSAKWKGKYIWRNRGNVPGRYRLSSARELNSSLLRRHYARPEVSRSNVPKGCKWREWLQSPTSFWISTGLIVERVCRTSPFSVLHTFAPLYPTISEISPDPFFPSIPSFEQAWDLFNPLLLSTWNFRPRNLRAHSLPLSLLSLSTFQACNHRLSYGDNMLISHSQC